MSDNEIIHVKLFDPSVLFDQFHHQLLRMDGPEVEKCSSVEDESKARAMLFDITMCINCCVGTDSETGKPAADWPRLKQLQQTLNDLLHRIADHHDQRQNKLSECEHERTRFERREICRDCGEEV